MCLKEKKRQKEKEKKKKEELHRKLNSMPTWKIAFGRIPLSFVI